MFHGWHDMTLDEKCEALWGLRNGSAMHMNRIRREGFEALKHLILERDLPKTIVNPPEPAKVVRFRPNQLRDEYLLQSPIWML